MTVHKYAAMIKAKVDNMELVVFCRGDGRWFEFQREFAKIAWREDCDYFLCLPQHKEACLHWLNGGEVQYKNDSATNGWGEVDTIDKALEYCANNDELLWKPTSIFFTAENILRIKPRKEKRWILLQKRRGSNANI